MIPHQQADRIPELEGIGISTAAADVTTTFENITTPEGRIQYLHHRAPSLDISHVPETWRSAREALRISTGASSPHAATSAGSGMVLTSVSKRTVRPSESAAVPTSDPIKIGHSNS